MFRKRPYFKFCLLLGILMFSFSTRSQESGYITGRLLDVKTGEPVMFATIHVKGRALGVISNADGGFRVPDRYRTLGNILVISSIGYQTVEMQIEDLSDLEDNIINMHPGVLEIPEVVLTAKRRKKLTARQIVRRAIAAIPDLYPTDAFSAVGYYRDYQFEEGEYINLNEAMLEVFDAGFSQPDLATTQTRIYEYRTNEDFRQDRNASQRYNYSTGEKVINHAYLYNYGGNEFTILRIHDAIRNYDKDSYDFVNVLQTELLRNHYFSREDDTFLDDEVLYTVGFSKILPAYRAYGRIYVGQKDFAIHKLEYALYDNLNSNSDGKLNKYGNSRKLIFEVITEYRREGTKMYPNYISFHNAFQLNEPTEFDIQEFVANWTLKCFIVKLNAPPNEEDGVNKDMYKVFFKDEKLKLRLIKLSNNEIYLYPEAGEVSDNMFEELRDTKDPEKVQDMLRFEVGNIRDTNGEELYAWNRRDLDQYREFFVQRIYKHKEMPKDTLFMSARRPIFKDQPIVPEDSLQNYWMNTPLQRMEPNP